MYGSAHVYAFWRVVSCFSINILDVECKKPRVAILSVSTISATPAKTAKQETPSCWSAKVRSPRSSRRFAGAPKQRSAQRCRRAVRSASATCWTSVTPTSVAVLLTRRMRRFCFFELRRRVWYTSCMSVVTVRHCNARFLSLNIYIRDESRLESMLKQSAQSSQTCCAKRSLAHAHSYTNRRPITSKRGKSCTCRRSSGRARIDSATGRPARPSGRRARPERRPASTATPA